MKEVGKIIIRFAIAAALLTGLYAYFYMSPEEQVNPDHVLVVGSNVYPPFIYPNEVGEMIGLDVDVSRELAKRLGKKLEVRMMAFDALIVGLQQKRVDLIIAGMDISPSRLARVDMVSYFGGDTKTLSLLFWDQIPQGITSLDTFIAKNKNLSVCTLSGSTLLDYLTKAYPDLNVTTYGDIDEVILEIRYKKSDVALLDTGTATQLAQQHPQLKLVTYELPPEYQPEGVGICVAKNNSELYHAVLHAVAQMKTDGTLQQLVNTWIKKEK